jgi:hypothetical protein
MQSYHKKQNKCCTCLIFVQQRFSDCKNLNRLIFFRSLPREIDVWLYEHPTFLVLYILTLYQLLTQRMGLEATHSVMRTAMAITELKKRDEQELIDQCFPDSDEEETEDIYHLRPPGSTGPRPSPASSVNPSPSISPLGSISEDNHSSILRGISTSPSMAITEQSSNLVSPAAADAMQNEMKPGPSSPSLSTATDPNSNCSTRPLFDRKNTAMTRYKEHRNRSEAMLSRVSALMHDVNTQIQTIKVKVKIKVIK